MAEKGNSGSDSKRATKGAKASLNSAESDYPDDHDSAPSEPFQSLKDRLSLEDLMEVSETSAKEFLELLNASSAQENPPSKKGGINEELLSKLGSGENDYGMLEELLPPIDFNAIPLTQPKRVKSKSEPSSTYVLPDNEGNPDKGTPKVSKRKKKPASLLDSYFKGL